MADETELHPAVELLLARMESHPEEFQTNEKVYTQNSRVRKMNSLYGDILNRASEKEVALLRAAMDKIQLDLLHNDLMDELLNGEDRRAQEEKENGYVAELMRKQLAAQNNQLQPYGQALGLAPGQYGQAVHNETLRINSHGSVGIGSVTPYTQLGSGITGKSPTSLIMDEYANTDTLPVANGGTGATPPKWVKKFFRK